MDYLIEQSRLDSADPDYAGLIRSTVPKQNLDYAMWVVLCDGELQSKLHWDQRPVFCLAYLVNKLLVYSSLSGALPTFGRDYATDIVVYKLQAWSKLSSRQNTRALVTPNQAVSLSAFAAGLSLSFISDDNLSSIPIGDLAKFKERCFPLLQKHQARLIETSQAFNGISLGCASRPRSSGSALRRKCETTGSHRGWPRPCASPSPPRGSWDRRSGS